MRILFLSNVHPTPLAPGKGTFNGSLVRALGQQHDVHVVCPISWIDQLRFRGKKLPQLPVLLQPTVTASYPTFWYPPKILRTYYDRFLHWSIRRRILRDLQTYRPDAVLSYWAHPDGAVALRIARELGVPAISMVGGSDVLLIGKAGARRTAILNTLKQSDAVIAVSHDIATQIVADGVAEDRVYVVRRGVDEGIFYPGDKIAARQKLGLPLDAKILVGVGRLVPVKDWPTLVSAMSILQAANPNVRCYLIGEGPGRAGLERQIADLGLQDQVELRGPQPQRDLGDWYRAADFVVLPSLSEGIPNVLLEAKACGADFVATNVGGIPEIADAANDSLVPAGDPAQLAAAIQTRLLNSTASGSDRQSSARQKPLSWQASAERVIAIIRGCQRRTESTGQFSAEAVPESDGLTPCERPEASLTSFSRSTP